MKRESTSRLNITIAALAGAIILTFMIARTLGAAPPDIPGDETCLGCHAAKSLSTVTDKGELLSLYVDKAALDGSVHGKQVGCTGCHSDIKSYPHPKRSMVDRRSFAIESYSLCQQCHSVVYQKALDSVHSQVLKTQNQNAPICTDCHGYHNVVKPDTPKTRVSQTCANCHRPIFDNYVGSVHGKALTTEDNPDVPVCTDCHGIHNIKEARTASFRIESPEVCAGCHTNKEIMSKYNISTDVYQTYRNEFHGITTLYYKVNFPTIWCYKAVCTDCHGVHDIKPPDDPSSSVAKANLVNTCGKCHEGANQSFTDAWTGHLPPSPEKGFLIWAAQAAWAWFLIPVTVVGMLVHIGFDWRKARQHRRRESEDESR